MLQSVSHTGLIEASRWLGTEGESGPVLVSLLGGFRVIRGAEVLPLLPESKLGVLLRRLALTGAGGVSRQELLGLLWPDADDALTARCLNTLVTELRHLLRVDADGVSAVTYRGGCYRLQFAAGVVVDVNAFDDCFESGHAADATGDLVASRESYERAADLYRGDLFTGHGGTEDVWLFVERERLHSRCLTTLGRAADLAGHMGDIDTAMAHAARLLRMDPCSEVGHRLVMHVYMLGGHRSQALHQYRVCTEALRREYGAEPEPATTAFFHLLCSGGWTKSGGCELIGS